MQGEKGDIFVSLKTGRGNLRHPVHIVFFKNTCSVEVPGTQFFGSLLREQMSRWREEEPLSKHETRNHLSMRLYQDPGLAGLPACEFTLQISERPRLQLFIGSVLSRALHVPHDLGGEA